MDAAPLASANGVKPVVADIAVERFASMTMYWKSKFVFSEYRLVKGIQPPSWRHGIGIFRGPLFTISS